jgi:hypothetical protein
VIRNDLEMLGCLHLSKDPLAMLLSRNSSSASGGEAKFLKIQALHLLGAAHSSPCIQM